MNQILSTRIEKDIVKKEMHPAKIFAITIIIFALLIMGVVGYNYFSKEAKIAKATEPVISIERVNNKVKISITHDKIIERVLYSWNDEANSTIYGMGKTELTKDIDIISGINTFNVTVIDEIGKKVNYKTEFNVSEDEDLVSPEIDMALNGNRVRLTVTDNIGVDHIKYKWNDEEFSQVDLNGQTKVEFEIEILKGENSFTMVAFDAAGNEFEKSQKFKGVNKPKVEQTKDETSYILKLSDDVGLQSLMITLNGEDIVNDLGGKNTLEVKVPLDAAKGITKIMVYNTEGVLTQIDQEQITL